MRSFLSTATLCLYAWLGLTQASSTQAPIGSLLASRTVHACKPVPGDAHWPDKAAWDALNSTVSGRLLAPGPPAAPCYNSSTARYNQAACSDVTKNWFNSTFHSDDPVSVDWPNWADDACVPPSFFRNGTAPPQCRTELLPQYVVNATSANEVAAAIKFAGKFGVRLIVKATGHDMLGRSTAPNALSIWTHYIRNLTYHSSFVPQSCAKVSPHSAVTVGAGHQWGEMYDFVSKWNRTLVGGADPNVGLGGWLTGGGHSPISAKYGLGVDNTLEMVVVTPTGEVVVANECQNVDLFWAMRGGGGSTFGVLISATMKAIPELPVDMYIVSVNSTKGEALHNSNARFWDATANLNSQLPVYSEAGLMGYYFVSPLESQATTYSSGTGQDTQPPSSEEGKDTSTSPWLLAVVFYALGTPNATVEPVFKPFLDHVRSAPAGTFDISFQSFSFPSFQSLRSKLFMAGSVGLNAYIASRLWDEDTLRHPSVRDAVRDASVFGAGFQGLFVSGPGVRAVNAFSSAVTPAWRSSYLHAIGSTGYDFGGDAEDAKRRDTDQIQAALTRVAPNSGAYLNEADPFQKDWREAFWGCHYPRLVQIKKQVDPNGVFWCSACVGAEFWKQEEHGRVCRTSM